MAFQKLVFIVGCGRSGTTALGRALSIHPEVQYLNEPRATWRLDPRTDIWSKTAHQNGRLDLYDVTPKTRDALRAAFSSKSDQNSLLVEKTPINAFRIDYLRAVFPEARFLHIVRNGLEVARSIAKQLSNGALWYGVDDIKWRLLATYAKEQGFGDLVDLCSTHGRRRGLLEWRLAVSHARPRLTSDDLEVRYEHLVEDSTGTLARIMNWCGIDRHPISPVLERRSPIITNATLTDLRITGELLSALGYLT